MNAKNDLILILFMRKIILFILFLITFLTLGCIENIYWGDEIENVTFSTDYLVGEECNNGNSGIHCSEYIIFGYNKKAYSFYVGSYSETYPCWHGVMEGRCCKSECVGQNKSEELCEKCKKENSPKITKPSDTFEEISNHKITISGEYNKLSNSLFNLKSPEFCLFSYNDTDCIISKEFNVTFYNASACEKYADQKQRECYETFISGFIENIVNSWIDCGGDYMRNDGCCYKLVSELKDEEMCNPVSESKDKNFCFTCFAIFKKDLKICEKTNDPDECVESVSMLTAISNRDIKLCEALSKSYMKDNCIIQVAEETGNAEICEEFKENLIEKEECYGRIALKLKEVKYCDYVPNKYYSDSDECILSIAIAKKDKKLCEKISGTDNRPNLCLRYIDNANKVDFFCDANDFICVSAFMK